jgi:hypothetical protein
MHNKFTTRDAYNVAKRAGSYSALYRLLELPEHADHANATAAMALMASDARGESNGYGAQAAVRAAIAGRPYAIATQGPEVTAWV